MNVSSASLGSSGSEVQTQADSRSTIAVLVAWAGLLLIARDAIFVQLRVRGRAAFVGVMLELVTSVLQQHQATVLVVFAVAVVIVPHELPLTDQLCPLALDVL